MLKEIIDFRLQFKYCQYGIGPDPVAVQAAISDKKFWNTCTEARKQADPGQGPIYVGKPHELGIQVPENGDKNQIYFVQIPAEPKKASDWVKIGCFEA